jgi:hypothetical protein
MLLGIVVGLSSQSFSSARALKLRLLCRRALRALPFKVHHLPQHLNNKLVHLTNSSIQAQRQANCSA